MPTTHRYDTRKVDHKALEAYLRSRGLAPRTGKWAEVWHRKRHCFLL